MSIVNPTQLVAEFKKSGEFDRLRREMLAEFRKSDAINHLMSRVEDIARQKLHSDKKLEYMPQEAVHRELMDELDRYPVVERAVGDFRARSDASFSGAVNSSLKGLLSHDRNKVKVEGDAREVGDQSSAIDNPASDVHLHDHPNQNFHTSAGLQNDCMDIEDSSDESVIDVSNKPPPETTINSTERTA